MVHGFNRPLNNLIYSFKFVSHALHLVQLHLKATFQSNIFKLFKSIESLTTHTCTKICRVHDSTLIATEDLYTVAWYASKLWSKIILTIDSMGMHD